MIGRHTEPPQFGAAIRGYDRGQVDAHLAGHVRWATQAWTRIEELEARVSELVELSETSRRDREAADLLLKQAEARKADAERTAAEVLEEAQVRAEELSEAVGRDREKANLLVEQAEAHKTDAERTAAEVLEEAQARASEICQAAGMVEAAQARAWEASEAARHDREKADRGTEHARQRVSGYMEQVEAAAAERAREIVNGTQPHLDQLRKELEHLEDQRALLLGELTHVRQSLDGILHRGATDGPDGVRGDSPF
jgi:DNA repair exonuclease SbcCD ATPase subunit